MASGDYERRPLLADENSPPPEYTEVDESKQQATTGRAQPPYGYSELPPPYTPNVITTHINCKVCQNPISLEGRQHLHVIKCTVCNEATPIKNPPAGKKYVRCPCNCLLICNVDSMRIACPRQNCGRVIALQQPGVVPGVIVPTVRIRCAHCNIDLVARRCDASSKLVRCSHCSKLSFASATLKKQKITIYIVIGLIFLLAGGIVTGVSLGLEASGGFYVIWIGAFIVGILNLIRAAIWSRVPLSPPALAGANS